MQNKKHRIMESVRLNPKVEILNSKCSCTKCDSVNCFVKRQAPCPCGSCTDNKTCLFHIKEPKLPLKSGSNNIKNIEKCVVEHISNEVHVENNIISMLHKNSSKKLSGTNSQKTINLKDREKTSEDSLKETRKRTAKLSAHIPNLPNKDLKKTSSKSIAPNVTSLSPFDIFNRIKKAYKACSCKVCECIGVKSLKHDLCKCKPCDCNECTGFNRHGRFKESRVLKDDKGRCPCMKLNRGSCKAIGRTKKKSQDSDCIGLQRYECLTNFDNIIVQEHNCNKLVRDEVEGIVRDEEGGCPCIRCNRGSCKAIGQGKIKSQECDCAGSLQLKSKHFKNYDGLIQYSQEHLHHFTDDGRVSKEDERERLCIMCNRGSCNTIGQGKNQSESNCAESQKKHEFQKIYYFVQGSDNLKNFQESSSDDERGFSCIRCNRGSCKSIRQGGEKCDCVGLLKCEYIKNLDNFVEDCDCIPCKCKECRPTSIRRERAVTVALVRDEYPHRTVCQCSPCECFECANNSHGLSPNLQHEMSTGVNRHPNCHCETCLNDACVPDDNQTCRCERPNKVMSKPFQQDSHDYDIRRATVTYDDTRRHKDTISMLANVNDLFPNREASINLLNTASSIMQESSPTLFKKTSTYATSSMNYFIFDTDYERVQNTLKETRAFSLKLVKLLEKYEQSNREFESVSEKIIKSNEESFSHNDKNIETNLFGMDDVPTKEQDFESSYRSSTEFVENNKKIDNINQDRYLSKESGHISVDQDDNNEGRDESGDDIIKINHDLLRTITEVREPIDVNKEEGKKVVKPVHNRFNQMTKRSLISPERIKSFKNICKVKIEDTIEKNNKIANSNPIIEKSQTNREKNMFDKDIKKDFHNELTSKTELRDSANEKKTKGDANLQKDVFMVKQPMIECSKPIPNVCEDMKVNFLTVRRVSDHTVLVKWKTPRVLDNVEGYELLVDGRAVQKILSPSRCIAVVTCLPHSDKVLLTVRTVLYSLRYTEHTTDYSPAVTVIYQPKSNRKNQ